MCLRYARSVDEGVKMRCLQSMRDSSLEPPSQCLCCSLKAKQRASSSGDDKMLREYIQHLVYTQFNINSYSSYVKEESIYNIYILQDKSTKDTQKKGCKHFPRLRERVCHA